MPLYHYKAVTPGGEVATGELEAANQAEIVDRLRDQGMMPMQIGESAGAAAGRARRGRGAGRRWFAPKHATEPDPWSTVAEKYPVDTRVNGTIVKIVSFGAFVSLESGIDGLIHISNLGSGRRINHPREVVQVGQWVEAHVLAVDPVNRRISLSIQPKLKPEKIVLPGVGELIEVIIEKIMPFGVFVKLDNGLTGLIPNSEMGTPPGTDHGKMFSAGSTIKVVVVEVDTCSGKISLSRKGVAEKEEQEEFNRYMEMVKKEGKSSGGLGNLGEKLKAKMEEKEIVKIKP